MKILFITISALLLSAIHSKSSVAQEDCKTCHETVVEQWANSHHAKSMSIANSSSVLADFDNHEIKHFDTNLRFYKEGENFVIEVNGSTGKSEYQVSNVFGFHPLQQYLIKREGGKKQVFPFAWDTRPLKDGGQRWFSMYPNSSLDDVDRFHWTQPLQNWNGMCADCHSTNLQRNYDISGKSFNTEWEEINVSCTSCHSVPQNHSEVKTKKGNRLIKESLIWLRGKDNNIAQLHNLDGTLASLDSIRMRSQEMESCFACHSLRLPLTNDFSADESYLDQFHPTFLGAPIYYPDGQPKEESFVLGSFLQSKMFKAGVICSDCHNPHTLELKQDDNAVCLQCHKPSEYQKEKHTGHPIKSDASKCVSCHMPETNFMHIDGRRDHSFRVPNPLISEAYGAPNACLNCHSDKNNMWSKSKIESWRGEPLSVDNEVNNLLRIFNGSPVSQDEYINTINSEVLTEFQRASALLHAKNLLNLIPISQLIDWSKSSNPLIRLSLAQSLLYVQPKKRELLIHQLLEDEYKAVRVAVAQQSGEVKIPDDLFKEALVVNQLNSWRGEANINLANLFESRQEYLKSIEALQNSIEIDPYFETAYINLADLYRLFGNIEGEKQTYNSGLIKTPKSAPLNYSYALHLIRNNNLIAAIKHLEISVREEPSNSTYAYALFLAIERNGDIEKALSRIMKFTKNYPSKDIIALGIELANRLNNETDKKKLKETYRRLQNKIN